MRVLFAALLTSFAFALAACGGTAPIAATPQRPPLVVATAAPTLTVEPTAGLVTATAEPLNAVPTATEAPQGLATAVAPEATTIPVAPVAPTSKLVGTYSAILPAADAPGRIVALELAVDGTATMTTQFIGKGDPVVETGTWTEEGDNAVVTFTQSNGQPEDNRITWTLQGTGLVTTDYDQGQYGTAGLPLARVGSGDIIETAFGGVSFSFDSSLAQSAQGTFLAPVPVEQAPALGGGAPEGVQFIFNNETLPDFFDPTKMQVYVYPVEGLKQLDPSIAQGVESLEKMIADKSVPENADIFVFPLIPASQVFHAQTRFLDFVNGSGFSFITYYAQDVSPIQSQRVFYTFQGITLDGKEYVSVFWPISSPALPTPPDSISAEEYAKFAQEYETYLQNLVNTLNSLPPAGFSPNLTFLNNMVQSIRATPLYPTPTPAPATPEGDATTASAQAEATPATEDTPQAQGTLAPQATAVAESSPAPGATSAVLPPAASGEMVSAEYEGVRFSFDKALAQSAQGVTIPAVPVDQNAPALGGGAPQNTGFGFNGEQVTGDVSPFQPQVRVYNANDLKALDPAIAREVLALKTLLSTEPKTLDDAVPVFPPFNAQQMIQPQIKYLRFKDGEGVRFVTFYAQDQAPVTNDGLFYTFQGLSADGSKYVTAFWNVTTDALPNSYQDANVGDINEWVKQFEPYRVETENKLDALPTDAFTPNLALLDQMIESLQVPQ